MADVWTHQDTGIKFLDCGSDYGGVRLMHMDSGVLRIISEYDRNDIFVCWEKDEVTNPVITTSIKKPAKGLDDLVNTIVAELEERGL